MRTLIWVKGFCVLSDKEITIMDISTLKALQESILHWKENLARAKAEKWDDVHIHAEDCALCKMFSTHTEDTCVGCPVADKAGEASCNNTPYYDVRHSLVAIRETERAMKQRLIPPTPKALQARKTIAFAYIKDEVAFLESLLPKKEN